MKKWIALLTALVVLFSGNIEFYAYAVQGGGLKQASAPGKLPMDDYIETGTISLEVEEADPHAEFPEVRELEDLEQEKSGLPNASAEEQSGEQEKRTDIAHASAEEGNVAVAKSTGNDYFFVIADRGQDNYRPWEDMTVELGENYVFDFHLARYENGEYEIVSTNEWDMGIKLFAMSPTPQFALRWEEGDCHYLVISPEYTRSYTMETAFTHPESGERISGEMTLHIVKQKYYFVVCEPGGEDYRLWDDATIRVGDKARYALHMARLDNGAYRIDEEVEWGVLSQENEHFTLEFEGDGAYINVAPTQPGTYSIKLCYTKPYNGIVVTDVLTIHVVGQDLDRELFKVVPPSGTPIYWRDGQAGAVTVYYDGMYDPSQTLTVTCRDDFSRYDPEGVLKFVSTDGEETVYAMARTSWEKPCVFRSGDTVMSLYILVPEEVQTRFVLYDADTALDALPTLADGMLEPGQEAQIAVIMETGATAALLADPLEIVRLSPTAIAHQEPGERYFTLISEEGNLTLGIQRGHSQTVWIGARKLVEIYMTKKGTQRYSLLNGDKVRSRISVQAVSNYTTVPGLGPMFRSSTPDVIRVEPDEEDDSRCYLVPVGFGETVISLDSDSYYCQLLLTVTDWDIAITAIHSDPASVGLPSGAGQWGPIILPETTLVGTTESPALLPCFSEIKIGLPTLSPIDLWSYESGDGHFTSSDPDIVEVIQKNCFEAYLKPVSPGVCTITYQEGPFQKEIVVRSQPDALQQAGCIEPGFYTYYGSAQVRKDTVSLADGQLILMAIASEAGSGNREPLSKEHFRFSEPGIAKVALNNDDLFNLIPVKNGTTTLTYTTKTGAELHLQISVGLPEPIWDFVVSDELATSGYRFWDGVRAAVGDRLEQEIFFALVTPAGDGSIHTATLLNTPEDLTVEVQDSTVFRLEQRGASLYAYATPKEAGEFSLCITATPPGASSHTWEKRLYVSEPVLVTENTVAAINEAIRTAAIVDGYETVIKLPQGYIPMDGDTPVLLSRPVTLRGQNTVLASDVVALSTVPGAKLQDITIRFDELSTYNGTAGRQNRTRYHFVFADELEIDKLLFAIYGDGFLTLENCVLDGGTGSNRCQYGIAAVGDGISFQGANTIQNFTQAGWVLYSTPGLRRYFQGLTFSENAIGVQTIYMGSSDPFFIRLIDSNFIGNAVNVLSDFPVNFSHNYFDGGDDAPNITKSPQYLDVLSIGETGTPAQYPNLYIEKDQLASTELLNFEGQAPIDTTNFTAAQGPVQIAVKALDDTGVGAKDSSAVLLQWTFTPAPQEDAVLFRPDAYIDETFELPSDSGIDTYQGVSFAHHGPLPMDGAEISVQKRVLFEEDILYLYRLVDGVLTYLGEIDNTAGDFYTFYLDGCSDYIITNVVVDPVDGGDGSGGGGNSGNRNDPGSENGTGTGDKTTGNNSDPSGVTTGESDNQRQDETGKGGNNSTAGEALFEDTQPLIYDYTHLPAPSNSGTTTQRVSVNSYVDDAAIYAAFERASDGQVVIDVSVKTVLSPLAFELLAENPALTLVLKGDGYEWRFSGDDILMEPDCRYFDTSVRWETTQHGKYARLSFRQQGELPGNCGLILEAVIHPREWVIYNTTRSRYEPCELNVWQQGKRLQIQLDALADYVAIL